jgi:hypothetical protein
MKKTILYILVILTLIITSALSYAADTPNSELTGQNPAIDLLNQLKAKKKSFTGENMYLEVYNTVNGKPAETATKNVADKLGVSAAEVEKIVKTGDISSLINANKDATLENIQQEYMVIMQLYTNSVGTETLRTDLESQVSPSEIFADGDTSNSDFDLLYDLNIVETILFNETTPSDFGSKHPAIKINILSDADKAALEGIFNPQAAASQTAGQETGAQGTGGVTGTGTTESEQIGTNPLTCLEEESALSEAMNKFEEENANGQGGSQGGGSQGEGGQGGAGNEIPKTVTSETMPSAEPSDWPTKYLCPDAKFFCITIDLVMTDAEVKNYPKTANCIACHIQKINETLDKVIKKPTSPNKLAGSKMEMPKCKSAFTNINVNMNVITMAIPPPLQENEDVFFKAKIEDQWKKFNETYKPLWYAKTDAQKKAEETNPATPQIAEKAAKKALMDASADATLEDVSQRTNSIITTMQKETVDTAATVEKEKTTSETNQKYQLIINELNTMNNYFKTIKDTIIKMKTPCDTVSSKPKCS